MSHYSRVRTKMKNRAALIKALVDMGFQRSQIQVHDTAVKLEGYEGSYRKQTAEIVIKRHHVGGAANDLGFKLREDGTYEAIVSDYDSGNPASRKNDLTKMTRGYSGKWMKLLSQRYSFRVLEEQANLNGYALTERWEDGEIVGEISRGY